MIDLNEYDQALRPYGLTMDEFVRIRKSKEFEQLDAEMSRVSPRYLEIPPTLRETALVAVLAGKTKNLSNIYDSYYTRQIPSFEEFISPKYLPKTGKTLFNTWKTELTKFFDPNKAYFEAIFTGAIGTGKSTAAMVAQVYNLVRITSLSNPQMAMGVAPTTQMTLLLMSILKGKAYQVLLSPLITLMNECPVFQQVPKYKMLDECFRDTKGTITPFWVGHDSIQMPNNVFVQVGSQMQHAIGAGLFGASLDEAEFRRGATASSTYELYYQLKERVRSRFIGLRYICLTLMSSVQSETGMITQYAKSIPEDSPHTVIYDYPIWTVRFPNAIKEDGYFYAMRGNISHPSRTLTPEECIQMDEGTFTIPPGCKVIQVPKRYYQEFVTNVSVALKNLAGMTSVGDEKPFSDTSGIEADKLNDELTFDVDLEKPNEPPFDIGKVLEQAGIFVRQGVEWQLNRYPDVKHYIHCDLAQTGLAGLSLCHKEIDDNGKIIYVFDFILRISTKNTISFEAIRRFIYNLKSKYNVRIHTLSCDQYQCFTGDTKISLMNGEEVPIKDLVDRYNNGETLYTYTLDHNKKKLTAGRITKAWCTGTQQIMKVYLDNGEVIRCTKTHRFMLRDGTYKEAQYLEPNESLMPLYRTVNSKGYESVMNPFNNSWGLTYGKISNYFNGKSECRHIHHKDFNKKNNNPDNLVLLTKEEHLKIHNEQVKKLCNSDPNYWSNWIKTSYHNLSDERREEIKKIRGDKLRESVRKLWSDPEYRKKESERLRKVRLDNNEKLSRITKESYDKNNGQRRKEQAERIAQINKSLKPRLNSKTSEEALARMSEANKRTWEDPAYQERMKHRYPGCVKLLQGKFGKDYKTNGTPIEEINRVKEEHRKQWEAKHVINHKVVKIEFTDSYEPVYDLEISNFQNFALSAGVFVHNSTMFRQYCLTNNIAENVILLSVDRNAEPYYQLANAVQAGQVKAGKCPYLREQLDIIRVNNNKPYAENGVRKDVADSCCGSVFNAICNGSDIPVVMYNELTNDQIYNMVKEELFKKGYKAV